MGHANNATSDSIYQMMSAYLVPITALLAWISHNALSVTRCFIRPPMEFASAAQRTARCVRMKKLVYLAISHNIWIMEHAILVQYIAMLAQMRKFALNVT